MLTKKKRPFPKNWLMMMSKKKSGIVGRFLHSFQNLEEVCKQPPVTFIHGAHSRTKQLYESAVGCTVVAQLGGGHGFESHWRQFIFL